ncbi:MAG TPA: hypothetical protein PLV92_25675, partial [Pirellulaceae bacterium]|nr:hypothetical protein [Pirellulaceae bacterium]
VMMMPPSNGNVGQGKNGPIVPPAPPKSSEAIASLLQQKADDLKKLQPNTPEFESSHLARASQELDSGALSAEDRQKLLGWMRATQAELDGSFAGAIVSLLVEQYGGAAASNAGASWAPRNSTVGAIPSSLLATTPISGRAGLMNLLTVAWLQPGDGTAPLPAAADPNELKREAAKWLKTKSPTPAVWASKLEQFEIEKLRAELQKEVAALKAEVGAVRTTAMNAETKAGDADTKATSANKALTAIGELKRADLEAAFVSLDARKKLDEFKPESLGDEIGEAIRAEFKAIWDDADGAAKALQAKVDDATEAWASKDAAPIREQLQRLQAGLVQLQLRRVTLAAAGPKSAPWSIDPLKKLGSGLHGRFVKLKEQEQAVDKELAELKKLADEMAGKTVAPDEGAALLARMQELLQVATQLELELAAKKQVPS